MRAIEERDFRFLIGQGYENKIRQEKGEEWFSQQIKKIANLLFRAGARIKEVSIVFEPKLKKIAWLREGKLLINLAKEEDGIIRALREIGIEVYTLEEIEKMKVRLSDLRRKYLQGDEKASEEYLRISELVYRFQG